MVVLFRDLPNDINEAISTLIFASARCGDLPELSLIRKLFGQRYGRKFATTAIEFQPGNLVNFQVLDSLLLKQNLFAFYTFFALDYVNVA